jgi:hypothetical protein
MIGYPILDKIRDIVRHGSMCKVSNQSRINGWSINILSLFVVVPLSSLSSHLMIRTAISSWREQISIVLLILSSYCCTLSVGQFLAGSEARNFEREAKAPAGSVFDAAMTAEMNAASGNVFQIDPLSRLDKITNGPLKNHIQIYLSKPVAFKLTKDMAQKTKVTTRATLTTASNPTSTSSPSIANTYRALVNTPEGIKLRGFWRRASSESSSSSSSTLRDWLELSYDDALRKRQSVGSNVEFEIQLPPLKGYSPSIVYSILLGMGSSNREAAIVKSMALVKIFPKGMDAKGFILGKTTVGHFMKAGIIDPSWCKGKTIFRTGRTVGQV